MTLLWPHKYQPKSLDELTYHDDLTNKLKRLADQEEFPHLLVYGPSGAGKKTRVACLLTELFGSGAQKIKVESLKVVTGPSKHIETRVVTSSYHSEITPSNSGNQDRFVIQEYLKTMAQSTQVDTRSKHRFKVVVIDEADRMSREAQAALRRTMEIYSGNLRLIMLAESTSSIIAPIKSRTLLLRVPAPTTEQVIATLETVAVSEGQNFDSSVYATVAESSNRNPRLGLAQLQAMALKGTTTLVEPDWKLVIRNIAKMMKASQTVQTVVKVRGEVYGLLSHAIPGTMIMKELLFELLALTPAQKHPKIIDFAQEADHRLRLGSKEIFHIEAFVAKTLDALR